MEKSKKPKRAGASIIVGLFLLAAVASVCWKTFGSVPAEASAEKVPDAINIIKVENIVVNLYDEEESHYLKTSIELEVESSKDFDFVTQRASLARNDMLLYLSSLSVGDTPGEKLKIEIQNKIQNRLNKALGADVIRHVYFTEFVVQ